MPHYLLWLESAYPVALVILIIECRNMGVFRDDTSFLRWQSVFIPVMGALMSYVVVFASILAYYERRTGKKIHLGTK